MSLLMTLATTSLDPEYRETRSGQAAFQSAKVQPAQPAIPDPSQRRGRLRLYSQRAPHGNIPQETSAMSGRGSSGNGSDKGGQRRTVSLDLSKHMDTEVHVKFSGGRQGKLFLPSARMLVLYDF